MLKRFLREKYLLMVCLQNLFAIPFFYWHKSSKIFLGQYSLEFILLIILPYVSMILFIFLMHKGYIRFSKIKNQTSSTLLPLKILFLIVGFFIAYILSIIKINYLGPIIFFCFISFFFLLLDRIFDNIKVLIPGFLLIIFSILLSAFEIKYQFTSRLSNHEKTNKLYYWGDEAMFRLPEMRNDKPISIGGRLKEDLNIKIHSYNKDSSASLITNSIGLRNKHNFSTIKNKNKLRILNLGDSFSIGYAMDQNQFFGNILKKKLAEKVAFKDIEILNAETSDPAHCSYFIQHYIDFHNPNIVLYGLGINDIMQSDLFLNEEAIFFINDNDSILLNPNYDDNYSEKRFNDYETIKNPIEIRANSKIKNNSNFIHQWNKRIDTFIILKYFKEVLVKKFEPKIKISQFSRMQEYEKNDNYKRLIDGNSYYGYFLKKTPKKVQNMYNKFFLLLKFMNKECNKRGIEFILLVYPHRYQIQTEYWKTVSDNFNFNTDDYDLSLMNKKIYKFCMENNIRLIDPKSSLNEIKSELFIDYDNHMNPEGYRIISDIVSEYIEEKIDIFSK